MKKVYFLDFCDPKVFNGKGKFVATSKARNDVTSIVKRCLETIYVPIIRHSTNKVLGPLEIIIRIYLALLKIPKGSYVLIQYPFVNLKAFRIISSRFKKFNTIAVIHDLPSLRFPASNKISDEIAVLNNFSCLIVHTEAMKNKLQEYGLNKKYCVLGCFDYLLTKEQNAVRKHDEIVFAGQLSKSIFLNDFGKLNFNRVTFNLYGKDVPSLKFPKFLSYKGAFLPNDISAIEGEWGLLWDGDSIDSCSGNIGEYLRIIAPHKLSLYIACQLKVIVWENSAMASYILDNHLGIAISKLSEIEEKIALLTSQDIDFMNRCIEKESFALRNGHMLANALQCAIEN